MTLTPAIHPWFWVALGSFVAGVVAAVAVMALAAFSGLRSLSI